MRNMIRAAICGFLLGIATLPSMVSAPAPEFGAQYVPGAGAKHKPRFMVGPDGSDPNDFVSSFVAFGREYGLTDAQIAGALGSVQQESQFDVHARNPYSGARGVAQWLSADRIRELRQFRKKNPSMTEVQVQAAFHWYEMEKMGLMDRFRKMRTVAQAAVFHRKYYERPGESEAEDLKRIRYGLEQYAKLRSDAG